MSLTNKHIIKVEDIRLEQSCEVCPEQYDAYYQDRQVGYLRLRWGHFTLCYPNVNGEYILDAEPEGHGCFEDHEREDWLTLAKVLIVARLIKEKL